MRIEVKPGTRKSHRELIASKVGQRAGVDGELARECRVFCSYLSGGDPDDYVLLKYQLAHTVLAHVQAPVGRFDRVLMRLAVVAPWVTRSVDSYARLLAPRSIIRSKLVLLLAILEVSAATYQPLETPTVASSGGFYVGFAARSAGFAARVLVTTILLLPLQLLLSAFGGLRGRQRS